MPIPTDPAPGGVVVPFRRFLARRFGSLQRGLFHLSGRLWAQRLDRLNAHLMRIEKQDNLEVDAPAAVPPPPATGDQP